MVGVPTRFKLRAYAEERRELNMDRHLPTPRTRARLWIGTLGLFVVLSAGPMVHEMTGSNLAASAVEDGQVSPLQVSSVRS
jgi:hypothetical protein